MTSVNLDLVQSIYADWEQGDFSQTPRWADEGIEWARFGGQGAGAWTGQEAITQAIGELLSSFDDIRALADHYEEVDDDRVLVLTRWSGRANDTGSEVELLRANLFRISDGRVARLIFYWDRNRALADLGLPLDTGA
jgi:ketosteroid isomerase-like protein